MLEIKVEGLNEALSDITQYEEDVQTRVKQVVGNTALKLQAKAIQLAPVGDGVLTDDILVDYSAPGEPLSAEVTAGGRKATHAAFVEYGTGVRGAANPHPPLPEDYRHGGGTKHKGEWPGMAAQPYMNPAAEEIRPQFVKDMQEATRKK